MTEKGAHDGGCACGDCPHAHDGGCACGDCPHGARTGHRRAVAEFLAQRDRLASGDGLPAALAHSAAASRQWASDALTQSAAVVAERGRAEGRVWLHQMRRRTLIALAAAGTLFLLAQALTAIGSGWTPARTAGLLAAALTGGALLAVGRAHRAHGGALAPLVGEDNRLSTSRAVAAAWVLLALFAVLLLTARLALAGTGRERSALLDGLRLDASAALLAVVAVVSAAAALVRRLVVVRVRTQRLQKVPADRPRTSDLITDDAGRGSLTDVQYILVTSGALAFFAVRLAREPGRLPDLPWGLALLVLVSAGTYLAGKLAEGGRPVILSVVRAREPGDLDAPIRTGDDIEIRGAGFVPPGAGAPDRLSRLVVRVGPVHVHVPLVPVPGGFTNPTDSVLTVPVPVDIPPGRVDVQVITAAGVESNRCAVEVTD
ncbi:hypothetical protein QIS99_05565 [Streptomyces sp. B-S-A8]|uniref:Integral membrane protein n=1 Tax=Streptomyces solicavernae TaxID=3043614 RepID=A0ABT6RPJ3_9ACTN|nr:hypothetical protein [Streptomyces sp. B-S-A8]MDI3385688.1 hypothetical protein [Streptomyces sp. B-S-A8]